MLDTDSKIPLYAQVKDFVLQKIRSEEWPVGQALPTEQELQDMMSVSRVTVRHAIDELARDGLVSKKQGKGTFVSPPKLSYPLPKLTSFTEDMQHKGFIPASCTLRAEITGTPEIASILDLPDTTQFLALRRKRMIDDMILGIHDSHINLALLDANKICKELADGSLVAYLDRQSGSLYDLMEREHNITISHADESLEAIACFGEMATLLEIDEGAPVLYLERMTYNDRNQPIEFVKMYNRADIYKYSIRLKR